MENFTLLIIIAAILIALPFIEVMTTLSTFLWLTGFAIAFTVLAVVKIIQRR